MNKLVYLSVILVLSFITLYFVFPILPITGESIISKGPNKAIGGFDSKMSGVKVLNLSQLLSGDVNYNNYTIRAESHNGGMSLMLRDYSGGFFSRSIVGNVNVSSGFFDVIDSDGNVKKYYLNADINQTTGGEESYIIKLKNPPIMTEERSMSTDINAKIAEINGMVQRKVMKRSDANSRITSLKLAMSKNLTSYINMIKASHDTVRASLNISPSIKVKDFKYAFNGISLNLSKSEAERIKSMPGVDGVYEDREVHLSLDNPVDQINATSVWNLLDGDGVNVTGHNVKIGIIDTGIDYTHHDFGNCSVIGLAYSPVQPESYVLESPHPYTNKYSNVWTITRSGFTSISVHFVNVSTESNYDYVTIIDSNNNVIANYTGYKRDFWTPAAQGDTIKIELTSDYSITGYGFYVDSIANGTTISQSSCRVVGGYDFVNHDSDPMDDNGHGTHVAGIAAANGTIKGVAPDAELFAYKVLDSMGSGYDSNIMSAIDMAVSDSVDVISMSLGSDTIIPDYPLSEAIDNAVNSNIVVVIAAGNSGPGYGTIYSPGNTMSAITVGAVDKNNVIADFSSRGPTLWNSIAMIKPDVVAPGVDICSAEFDSFSSDSRCVDQQHISLSGTSMATPQVSGAVALLKQYRKSWTPDDIKSAIVNTATDLGYDVATQGGGLINVMRAINASILINPVSISTSFFGDVTPVNSTEIKIKNQRPYPITVDLSVENASEEYGGSYNISYLNATHVTIDANSEGAVLLTTNMTGHGGMLFGRIVMSAEDENYTVPYVAGWLAQLNVSVVASGTGLYPDLYIHTDDMGGRAYANQIIDFIGSNYTFLVPAEKNITVYAIGDLYNESLKYILMKRVESSVSGTNVILNLSSDSRPFTINTTALDGSDIKIYDLDFGFASYANGLPPMKVMYLFSILYSTYYNVGNQVIYLSNKPESPYDTDIILKYVGVPVVS